MSFKCIRPEDELGSGGKILRGRRFAVSASSPFVRPKPPPRSESPGFLTALFTGAGKLLSSVFVFSSSPSSLSSSASDICSASSDDNGYENDDDAYNGDENDDDDHVSDIRFKEVEWNQGFALGSQPVVQKSDAKLAIEQLILQETFSRGESIRLTKIIQSRVVDCPTTKESVDATQQELHDSTGRNSIASPGDWCSPSQTRSPGAFPCSANSSRVLTPDTFLSQAHLPVLSHVSIEAKKWFEEKLESPSNLDWDHGPCTLNTAMLPNVTEDEVCSPIDVDKFYTEARWPWASPSSSSIGFKTPIRMYPYNDETSCANARCSFASSEVPENAWKMKCDSESSEYSIPDSTSRPHNEFKFGVERHATRSQYAFSSSSLGLKSPGSVDRISWKSTGFSHCEFAAARTTEACHLLTEMSIDFPTTPKINGRNCANGPEIDATSDLGRLLQAEPPLNSSHGLARNSMKTFSKKGKKSVSYRRSRGQGK